MLKVDTAFNNNNAEAQKYKKYRVDSQNSKQKNTKLTNKIPHTTNVAAWIKADTGIGPSIASGNHMCNPNWVDLENAHRIKNNKNMLTKKKSYNMFMYINDTHKIPTCLYNRIKAINNIISPNLPTKKDLKPHLNAKYLNQKYEIKKKENKPINSQLM